jgi:hypothetical protein
MLEPPEPAHLFGVLQDYVSRNPAPDGSRRGEPTSARSRNTKWYCGSTAPSRNIARSTGWAQAKWQNSFLGPASRLRSRLPSNRVIQHPREVSGEIVGLGVA